MKTKIIEWNINQRLNFAGKDMPKWIADVIKERNAGIVALTEVYKGNNWEEIKKEAFNCNYAIFETSNGALGQNDIAIAVNTNMFDVIYEKAFLPYKKGIPDNLEVKLKSKDKGVDFLFECTRIHAFTSEEKYDTIKCDELQFALESTSSEERVIVCGDFNNFRRGCPDRKWNMNVLVEMCNENGFIVKTPAGASIYEVNENNTFMQFAEDHFLLKGIGEKFELLPYYRDFTEKDKLVYKWGKDFQTLLGRDKRGNKIYDSIPCPYPDHAILEAIIDI